MYCLSGLQAESTGEKIDEYLSKVLSKDDESFSDKLIVCDCF